MRVALLLALLVVLVPAAGANEGGLRTGHTHMVQVTSSPTSGLEVGMPRHGSYAKGIDLDINERWDDSLAVYTKALEEFRAELTSRPRWAKLVNGWIQKVEFQLDRSRRLRGRVYYSRYSSIPASTLYYFTEAKHDKWLAIRAFLGRGPRKMLQDIIDDYKKVIQGGGPYAYSYAYYTQMAQLALAALYHEAGQHHLGRQEYARVRHPVPTWMKLNLAYYHAAAGKTQQAVDELVQAVSYRSYAFTDLLRSNRFDRLRNHPRFRTLAGQ